MMAEELTNGAVMFIAVVLMIIAAVAMKMLA